VSPTFLFNRQTVPLTLPIVPYPVGDVVFAPPAALDSVQATLPVRANLTALASSDAFTQYIEDSYRNLTFGGLAIDDRNQFLIAHEVCPSL
jgi:hypothetical protein